MRSFPDFEALSYSEPNVQAKVLGVLLGDDYRACFLPRFLQRAGLEGAADWIAPDSQAVSFTRPSLACPREQATPEKAERVQHEINHFLGLSAVVVCSRTSVSKG